MVLFSTTGNGPGLDGFRKDIDVLAANGQKWVRMGIVGWEVMEVSPADGQVHWNENALKQYDRAVNYAYSKGLNIFLITADGANSPTSNFAAYKSTMQQFWHILAQRFAGMVTVWQVYSEADTAHYRVVNQPIMEVTSQYLAELAEMLSLARGIIKSVNPDVLLTTTSTGWPMSDEIQKNWEAYFDGIAQNLDAIALDVYPADNFVQIDLLSSRINATKIRYGKPVLISEVGLQVAGKWTAEDQLIFLPAAIEAAKRATPLAIIVYQLRDDGSNAFGLLREDWTPRPSFYAAIEAMKYQT